MKKSLIALAVAGVFAAPAAFAATSNVDIYGKLHVSVSVFDNAGEESDAGETAVEDLQISSNASRIGFKGSEDLGGGLKAIWQIESGVNLDEQTGTLGQRNSFVGLSGGFGTALIGNHDTPLKLVGRAVDLFGDTLADSRNVMGGGSDTRAKNVVAYISPSFSGFSVAAAYTNDLASSASNDGDAKDNAAWNVSGTYTNGPLFLGAAIGDGDAHDNIGFDEHWRLAGSYAMGDLKFVAQYDHADINDLGIVIDDGAYAGDSSEYDAWMLGVAYAMGPITLKANYMDGEVDGVNVDINQWTIGADYALSKRTSAYVLYTAAENACIGCGAGSSDRFESTAADGEISAFSVGVVHNF